jgi:hypothetical protein
MKLGVGRGLTRHRQSLGGPACCNALSPHSLANGQCGLFMLRHRPSETRPPSTLAVRLPSAIETAQAKDPMMSKAKPTAADLLNAALAARAAQ